MLYFDESVSFVYLALPNSSSHGSCEDVILKNETALRNVTSLPEIGTTVVDESDDRARHFYGNKSAVQCFIKSKKQHNKRARSNN